MSDVLRFLIYALAAFRITLLFYFDDGPSYVFDWIRHKAGIYYVQIKGTNVTETKRRADGFFGKVLNCPLCLSFWIASFFIIPYKLENIWVDYFFTVLGFWGFVTIIFRKWWEDIQ